MEARQRIEELTKILQEANYLYYVQDAPVMPDFEYDRLLRELEDLEKLGFSPQVLEAVALLTHADDVPYLEYVAKLKHNPIAKAVKLADLDHNSDMTRLGPDDPRIPHFQEKYRKAKILLTE